jgi:hypothetical protein
LFSQIPDDLNRAAVQEASQSRLILARPGIFPYLPDRRVFNAADPARATDNGQSNNIQEAR